MLRATVMLLAAFHAADAIRLISALRMLQRKVSPPSRVGYAEKVCRDAARRQMPSQQRLSPATIEAFITDASICSDR